MLACICVLVLFIGFDTASAQEETANRISRYPVPQLEDLPEDLKAMFLEVQEQRGFIPNVLFALAHRPDELRAFLAYNNSLINKESGLTAADKEMLIVAFSNLNGCMYCTVSHGAGLRLASGNPHLAEQVAANYREADISPRQKAMIAFGIKVTADSDTIGEEDFEILRGHGFTDEDIWDIAGITAFYNLSNRMMSFLAVRPDEEFYLMGRQ